MYNNTRQNTRNYLLASLFISGIDIIRTLLLAKIMGPYLTGLCTTVLLIPQIAQYLNLGLIEAQTVIIPSMRGKGSLQSIDEVRNSILNYTLITSTFTALLVLIYAFFFNSQFTPGIPVFFLTSAAFLIILWEVKQFFVTHYMIENNFVKVSVLELTFTLSILAIQIPLVIQIGHRGFWFGYILSNLIVIAYGAWDYFKTHRFTFEANILKCKSWLPLGLALVVSQLSYAPFIILSRIFIASKAGVSQVGFFILATIVISKISVIPSTISKVILPKLSMLHGKGDNTETMKNLFLKTQLLTFCSTLVLVAISLPLLYWLVPILLESYLPGLPAAKIMLFAAIPYSLIDNANSVLLAQQNKKIFSLVLLEAILVQALIFLGLSLTGTTSAGNVALGLCFVFAFYALVSNHQALKLLSNSSSKT